MREIAKRAGRGEVSSSTVFNIFKRPQVPGWRHLEHIINALDGAEERQVFHALWDAADRAEKGIATPQRAQTDQSFPPGHPGNQPLDPTPWPPVAALPGAAKGRIDATHRPVQRIWSSEIPSSNPNFTGRTTELDRLRSNLFTRQPNVQVISGMGGIGKTELATEYIHRNRDNYEIIWWIRAEQPDRVRDAFVRLGQRLELRQATTDSARDRTVSAVRETLQSGPWSWLLVFDNAANPLDLEKYIPACPECSTWACCAACSPAGWPLPSCSPGRADRFSTGLARSAG